MAEKQVEKTKEPKLESKLPDIKKIEKPGEISPFNFVSDLKKTTEKVEQNADRAFKELDKKIDKISSDVDQFEIILKPLENNKNADGIRKNVKNAKESLNEASEKIAQGAPEQEVKQDTDKATKYLEKARSESEKLLKEGDLSQSEKKALEQFLKNLDNVLVSLGKIGLSERDTITQRQNDEIFERTLFKNIQNKRNIDQFSEETIMIGISNYYFAVREMAKEIEATNSEKISKKEKEQKIEEIFEKHYETLKTGNEDHDKTLNSFLIYNMTMEFGSKEQKEKVSNEIKVKTEDGKETTLKDRCNKEIIELYNSCVSSPGFGWNEKEGCHKINQ